VRVCIQKADGRWVLKAKDCTRQHKSLHSRVVGIPQPIKNEETYY